MSKSVARYASYFAFILLLLSGNVASRHLHYDDAIKLASDGVSDGGASARVEESFLHLKGMDSNEEQCNHMYGFLPCSSNLLGHICLLMIYEFLLYHAESFAGGDGRIFRVFGKNFWVSCLLQLLDALPDSLILLGNFSFSRSSYQQSSSFCRKKNLNEEPADEEETTEPTQSTQPPQEEANPAKPPFSKTAI